MMVISMVKKVPTSIRVKINLSIALLKEAFSGPFLQSSSCHSLSNLEDHKVGGRDYS